MEEMMNSFMGLGCAGVVAGVLFKKFLEDSKNDKEYFRNEIKETREIYQNELKADREIYIESIERITNKVDVIDNRIDIIETDIKDIKNKL